MKKLCIQKQEAQPSPTQQPPDLRFCRAWWEYKKALYPKLSNAALRVFLAVEDRASRWNNYAVPMSLAMLGEETGVKHHTTLATGIRELEAAGILAVTRHAGNSRLANSYCLLIRNLIGDEQQISGNNNSSSNSPAKCECEGDCQLALGAKTGMNQGRDNCAPFNGNANYTSNRKISKAAPGYQANADANISSNQSSHAILATAPASAPATSAKIEPLPIAQNPAANSGSAENDTVLSCSNTNTTNSINWFNPDGLNGVTAAQLQPVKAKFDQRQRQAAHAGQPAKQPPITPVNSVQIQVQNSVTNANFEVKTYPDSYQPQSQIRYHQNQNTQQLQEEYFKRLSWATTARERMMVLFSALRMVAGSELEKAEFSGLQALVNEYGSKAVLTGILATLNRAVDRQAYFAYLRGVIRRQEQEVRNSGSKYRTYGQAAIITGNSYQPSMTAQVNSQRGYRRQLPIDLAKYTGSGKYAQR